MRKSSTNFGNFFARTLKRVTPTGETADENESRKPVIDPPPAGE
jgi:hypothetical protein